MNINKPFAQLTVGADEELRAYIQDWSNYVVTIATKEGEIQKTYQGERFARMIGYNTLPSLQDDPANINRETFAKDLEFLNARLDGIRKTIDYYDVYRINDVIQTNDSNIIAAKISALLPNSSLLIDTHAEDIVIDDKKISLKPGDVIVRDNSGKLYYIAAQTSGIFYPSGISGENGQYTITYSFSTLPVSPSDEAKEISTPVTNLLPRNIYANVSSAIENNTIYGFMQTLNGEADFTFNPQPSVLNRIYPVVKAFYEGEQVENAIEITYNNSQYTITNLTELPITVVVK